MPRHLPRINWKQLYTIVTLLPTSNMHVQCGEQPSVSHTSCIRASDIMCSGLLFLWANDGARVLCHSVTAEFFHRIRRAWSKCLQTSVFSLLFLVPAVVCSSPLRSLSSLSKVVYLFSLSFLHFLPRGRRTLNLQQKTQGGKTLQKHLKYFPLSLFWEMSSTPKEQFQKKQKVAD